MEDFVRNLRMAGYGLGVHRFQSSFLVVAILKNPIVESGGNDSQFDHIGSFVLPEPTMNSGTWRYEGSVALSLAGLVVDIVGFVIVGSFFARGFHIGFTVKLEEEFVAGHP